MPVYIDPRTGNRYEHVPDADAERARVEFGLERLEQYEREQRTGGVLRDLQTAGEEAIRNVAAVADLIPGVDAGAAPAGLTEREQGQDGGFLGLGALSDVYTPEARERREDNPIAAGLGSAAPAVAAGLLVPGGAALATRAAAGLGVDVVSGYSQEAVDAELEGRNIRGEDVLWNAGLNILFSAGAAGLGVGARKLLRGGRSVVEAAAERAAGVRAARAAAAEGDDLVSTMADPVAREELLGAIGRETDEAVRRSSEALAGVRSPAVANNPGAQREALETLSDAYERIDPSLSRELRGLSMATGRKRLDGLRDLRARMAEGDATPARTELEGAIDSLLGREDLWGKAALDQAAAVEAARKLAPSAKAGSEELLEYADALRRIPGLEAQADDVARLADRAAEAKVASTLPPKVTPKEAPKIVDDAPARTRAVRDVVVGRGAASGALQRFSDDFAALVSNAEKRESFTAFEAAMQPEVRAQLAAEARELASASLDTIAVLPETVQAKLLAFAEDAERSGSAADLDRLKNALQSQRKRYARLTSTDARAADYVDAIDSVEPRIRAALENPDFVGEGTARIQRARNAAWSNADAGFIRNQNRMRAAGFNLLDTVEVGYDGKAVMQVDAKAFESLLNAPPEQALKALSWWEDQIRASKQIVDTVAEQGARAKSFGDSADALLRQINELRRLKMAQDIVARAPAPGFGARLGDAAARRGSGAAVGAVVGGVVGGGLPGAVVGAVGGAAVEAAGPAIGRFARAPVDAASEVFGGSVDRLLEAAIAVGERTKQSAELTGQLLVNPPAARRYLRLAGDVGSAITRFSGDHGTPRQAFDEHRKLIEGFSERPAAFIDLMTEEFGDVSQLSPKLHREMVEQATRVAGYLRAHLPGRRNVSVVYPRGTPASTAEIRQFAMRFTAATDPASVFLDARAGRLQRVQLDTLRDLWPRQYDELRASVITELGKGKATTRTRQLMCLLFNFGDGVDPALGPRVRAIVAAARAEQERQAPAQPTAAASRRETMPSKAGLTPGGMASLSLGQQLTF